MHHCSLGGHKILPTIVCQQQASGGILIGNLTALLGIIGSLQSSLLVSWHGSDFKAKFTHFWWIWGSQIVMLVCFIHSTTNSDVCFGVIALLEHSVLSSWWFEVKQKNSEVVPFIYYSIHFMQRFSSNLKWHKKYMYKTSAQNRNI